LAVIASWEHRPAPGQERSATLRAEGTPLPFPDVSRYLAEPGELVEPVHFVQWDRPMPPPEAYGVLARMARFPEATVYKAGESYLGKDVWAMDLMSPIEASHFSHYKATTLKPTIIYSARQHANEVSSTSHVLKLAELLLTDPAERKKLVWAFERRVLDEMAYQWPTLWWQRIIPHWAKVKGWKITPSHYLNQDLRDVWLAKD
ncbi:MAG TPA: M14 family zinc carboxypeptidase, partial [Candidatus Methylomirabilis sp.]